MTAIIEGKHSFFINTPVVLVDESKDVASTWAGEHIYDNPDIKWIVAKYVEADNANSNGQYFALEDLRIARPTVNHSPMNIDHHQNEIVGTWVASELLYPTENSNIVNPYMEVVGAYWKHYNPDKLDAIEAAFNAGTLYSSMECYGDTITCVGTDIACGASFSYEGPMSRNYCAHIQERASFRQIDNPRFVGGALIVPPTKPGWKSARVDEMSNYIYDRVAESAEADWDSIDLAATLDSLAYRSTLARFNQMN